MSSGATAVYVISLLIGFLVGLGLLVGGVYAAKQEGSRIALKLFAADIGLAMVSLRQPACWSKPLSSPTTSAHPKVAR